MGYTISRGTEDADELQAVDGRLCRRWSCNHGRCDMGDHKGRDAFLRLIRQE